MEKLGRQMAVALVIILLGCASPSCTTTDKNPKDVIPQAIPGFVLSSKITNSQIYGNPAINGKVLSAVQCFFLPGDGSEYDGKIDRVEVFVDLFKNVKLCTGYLNDYAGSDATRMSQINNYETIIFEYEYDNPPNRVFGYQQRGDILITVISNPICLSKGTNGSCNSWDKLAAKESVVKVLEAFKP